MVLEEEKGSEKGFLEGYDPLCMCPSASQTWLGVVCNEKGVQPCGLSPDWDACKRCQILLHKHALLWVGQGVYTLCTHHTSYSYHLGRFLNGVGADGVGGIFPFFVFLWFFFAFLCFFLFFSRFSPILLGQEQTTAICWEFGGISLRPRLHRPRSELPDQFISAK